MGMDREMVPCLGGEASQAEIENRQLLKQKSKIDKYGSWIALITWLPFVGDVFAIGLGFYKLNFAKCAVFMLIGKGARFAIWILLFYLKTQL